MSEDDYTYSIFLRKDTKQGWTIASLRRKGDYVSNPVTLASGFPTKAEALRAQKVIVAQIKAKGNKVKVVK